MYSVSPDYRSHFLQLTPFFWLKRDTQVAQTAFSCFVTGMLCAAFGRTTEVTEMSWDEVSWDPHGQVATVSMWN
jgi:hypothetical protein